MLLNGNELEMKMKKFLSMRYILKVIVNLYYTSYDYYPDYGGEIDEISINGISSNDDAKNI